MDKQKDAKNRGYFPVIPGLNEIRERKGCFSISKYISHITGE